jgi:hypothetical protein
MTRSIDDELRAEIRNFVRTGFLTEDRVVTIFREERYAPGDLDPDEVERAVKEAFRSHRLEQKSWPRPTDCDRLRAVFDALNGEGILSIENLGWNHGDGYHEIHERHRKMRDRSRITGFCFFHEQDVEHAVAGHGLHLSFGPIDPALEDSQGAGVGRRIADELGRAGFQLQWNGTFKERILLRPFDWKRRI